MITISDIKRRYGEPIKRSFITDIEKYISKPIVQKMIKKALNYDLSERDRDWLFEYGGHKGEYPHLNYLCTIYIHPLTHAQHILRLDSRIRKFKQTNPIMRLPLIVEGRQIRKLTKEQEMYNQIIDIMSDVRQLRKPTNETLERWSKMPDFFADVTKEDREDAWKRGCVI